MKYLLAVSSGVDSMCLLHLFSLVASGQFGVIHIHHHWRTQSDDEALFLEEYCRKRNIPFYLYHWENPSFSEDEARQFRYHCYEEVMKQENYDILCTAHHLNDQAETMIQRLIRGSHLFHLTGIEALRPLGNGYVWRPFLTVTKKELQKWAKEQGIVYFEDETNEKMTHQRNRIRHQIIPLCEQEDPRFLYHMAKWNEQLSSANTLLKQLLEEKLANSVVQTQPWTFDLTKWEPYYQPCLLWLFFEEFTSATGQEVSDEFQQHFLNLISHYNGEKYIQKGEYIFVRQYHHLIVKKVAIDAITLTDDGLIDVPLNKEIRLSDNTAIMLCEQRPSLEKNVIHCWKVPYSKVRLRHPRQGDAIRLSSGHHQKLTRLFINAKIPASLRKEQWVVTSVHDEIIGVLSLRQSYLSKAEETGKIYYIIYYTLTHHERVIEDEGKE